MPEVIQDWLGTRLGVLIDMSPQKFGRNTQDGRLLAKLLYNYGVIPFHVFDKIKESKNYHDCYNNLVILKPWLDYIGVAHDDSTLQKMAGAHGSAAISIFYAVYLNLERKDRLHYISAQKERRYSEDACLRNFRVDWIPERQVRSESTETFAKLEVPLLEKRAMIEWHKAKCKLVLAKVRKTKENFRKSTEKRRHKLGPPISKHPTFQPLNKKLIEIEETREKISEFEKEHPLPCPDLTYTELIELKNMLNAHPCLNESNMVEARSIVNKIKCRKKRENYARNFEQKMQHMVLDDQWRKLIEKQDKNFENAVCGSLLKQSQYEKQMMSKLFLVRNQKKVLSENRKMINQLKMQLQEIDFDDMVKENLEMKQKFLVEDQFERERIAELHRRLYEDKVRLRKGMILDECRNITEALLDITTRIAEIREKTSCQVPKSFMKDLKELFFKNLPVMDLLDHPEELCDSGSARLAMLGDISIAGEETIYNDEEREEVRRKEQERQSALDESDLNDYLNLLGPWMVELHFPDASEKEVEHNVLGYIVHKLLEIKYPPPKIPIPAYIKPMKPKTMLLGLHDDTACEMLKDLMETCRILVVFIDDAINYVLGVYKEELSKVREIDLNFRKITEEALKDKKSAAKDKEIKKKMKLLKKEEQTAKSVAEEESPSQNKETQTPRVLPEEDPVLSPTAELGKSAFTALGAGDPVPDTIIIPSLIAYVIKQQENYDGWILVNYPILYSQASELEFALTGARILPLLDDMEYLEEVEGFAFRDVSANFSWDEGASNRTSRLVPKPTIFQESPVEVPTSYFSSVIKLMKVSESYSTLLGSIEDYSILEEYYIGLKLHQIFKYKNLNFQTIKNLGKTILDDQPDDSLETTRKTSLEVFGSEIFSLNEKWNPMKKKQDKSSAAEKKKVKGKESFKDNLNEMLTSERDILEVSREENKISRENTSFVEVSAKPGQPEWIWATGPQPEQIQIALASLWENMEAIFIEDFKSIFFRLRAHRSKIINYMTVTRKYVRNLMRRPDDKQKVLSDFQQMFNDIDEDLRPDVDIKYELHVRVTELEQALLGIADERKITSQKDLENVAQDNWVADELANLVNCYLSALQLEANRCSDSCQVIMDYYLSLQQKLFDDKRFGKVIVPLIQGTDRKGTVLSSSNRSFSNRIYSPKNGDLKQSNKSLIESHTSKTNTDRVSKTRNTERKRRGSDMNFLNGASEAIKEILINLSLPEDGLTPFHLFFIETLESVAEEITTSVEACIMETKKIEKPPPKSLKKNSDAGKIPVDEHLLAEWTTALTNELSRFIFRMKLILAKGIFEMNEFLMTILNMLSSLSEDITDLYLREIHSISECCKVFRCAIEEEMGLQPTLELREDEFIVNEEGQAISSTNVTTAIGIREDVTKVLFTTDQLNFLRDKLQHIAPDGEIIKRSLIYLLEDLKSLKPEIKNFHYFPEIWNYIDSNNVASIIHDIYQDLEVVHWKDFIIYGLDLPMPTEAEILTVRKAFRALDPCATELITRENYDTVEFWFEKSEKVNNSDFKENRSDKIKDLLFKMYQVDELQTNYSALLLAFCKDDNPIFGFTKALALASGKSISFPYHKIYIPEDFVSEPGEGAQSGDYKFFDDFEQPVIVKPFCCPTSSSDISKKCIPKERLARCECNDQHPKASSTFDDEDDMSYSEEGGEESSMFYYQPVPTTLTSVVPYNILSSLLKIAFPSLPQLTLLLDCKQTFQETLNSIYESLESFDDTVEVSKLVYHKFIYRLIQSTNKFKNVNLTQVLKSKVKNKYALARGTILSRVH